MAERLKVLLLIPHLGGGGAERVTALLSRGLSDRKYEIHLGLVTEKLALAGAVPSTVTVHALGASRVRGGGLRILALVRSLKPDVILSGMFHLNFVVLMLRPFYPAGTAVIVRQNATVSASLESDELPWYTGWLYRLLYRFADRIVCSSRAMAEDLKAELGIRAERLAVLPNPVDFEELGNPAGAGAWPGLGPRMLAVGRLSPEKGFDILLRAVALVRRDFKHACLVIAGKGAEEARLKALAVRLGIADVVWFAGYVERPWSHYGGADLFVLPSHHEGMPNALTEAVACGMPVAVTPASGGIVDFLKGRANAWLAADVSVAGLAEALMQAIRALEARTESWDRHRSERVAGLQALLSGGELLSKQVLRRAPVAEGTDGPGALRPGEFVGEFAFERAFEAYEAMIDSLCAECRA